jgi:hypothetical protein
VEVAANFSKKLFADTPALIDAFQKTLSIRGPAFTDEQSVRLFGVAV